VQAIQDLQTQAVCRGSMLQPRLTPNSRAAEGLLRMRRRELWAFSLQTVVI